MHTCFEYKEWNFGGDSETQQTSSALSAPSASITHFVICGEKVFRVKLVIWFTPPVTTFCIELKGKESIEFVGETWEEKRKNTFFT